MAGIVKGVVGFGVPLLTITLLTWVISLPTAIAATVAPSVVANFRQAFRGGQAAMICRRLWPFLIAIAAMIWVGIGLQVSVNPAYPGIALGALALISAGLSFVDIHFKMPTSRTTEIGVLTGVISGLMAGLTGIVALPATLYLHGLGLGRDTLVQALGILFLMTSLIIGTILMTKAILTAEMVALSVFAVPPLIAGVMLGERVRTHVSEAVFQRLFYMLIAAIGLSLVLRNGAAVWG